MSEHAVLGTLALTGGIVLAACAATARAAPDRPILTPLTKGDTSFGAGCYARDALSRPFFAEDGDQVTPTIRVRGVRVTLPMAEEVGRDGQVATRIGAWDGRTIRQGRTTVRFRVPPGAAGMEGGTDFVMTVDHEGRTEHRRLRMSCGS